MYSQFNSSDVEKQQQTQQQQQQKMFSKWNKHDVMLT